MKKFDFISPGNCLKKLNAFDKSVYAIGRSAYNRVIPGFFLRNYHNICLNDSLEKPIIEKFMKVECLENQGIGLRTSDQVLKNQKVQKYFKNKKASYLIPYRNCEITEVLADRIGLKILSNRGSLVDFLEKKANFLSILEKIQIETTPGKLLLIKDLSWKNVKEFMKINNEKKIVLQIADYTKGGGAGFGIVRSQAEYFAFKDKIKRASAKTLVEKIRIAKFIQGQSPSASCCITKYGVLRTRLRARLIGVPLLVGDNKPGSFAGYDWYYDFSESIEKQADKIIERVSSKMALMGYKGIFGIDFLTDEKTGKIYPTECNPRHLGPEPVSSLAQINQRHLPIDVFDLLEHLNFDYKINYKMIKEQFRKKFRLSQIFLFNNLGKNTVVKKELASGIYEWKNKELKFLRSGFANWDLNSSDEILITDRVPFRGTELKTGEKIFRIVMKKPVLSTPKKMKKDSELLVSEIYSRLGLV